MLTQFIWYTGILLEVLVLARGLQMKWLRRFPCFYSYLLFVFLKSLLLWVLFRWIPRLYAQAYWTARFAAVIIGCLVLFEIYRVALRPYPGTARMARNLLGGVIALAFAKVLVNHSYGPLWWPAKTTAELERNLRIVQAVALVAIVALIIIYAIPRDRHLKGILAGYGFYVSCSIMQLALLAHLGDSFNRLWWYLEPFSYLVVLCIWTVALWSHSEETNPSAGLAHTVMEDHNALVERTNRELENIRMGLQGMVRR